jgi:phosphate transport system permease protein
MQTERRLRARDDTSTSERELLPWEDPKVISGYKIRRLKSRIITATAIISVAIILYPLLDILFLFFYRGILAISIPRLTQLTLQGGLANSIVGTLLLVGLSAMIAIPLGVLGGIYLAEFSGENRFATAVRFIADVLAGMPSIVIGYVGFLLLVLYFGWGLSLLAGALTLVVLMLPYILRTTELSIRKVPPSLREASLALGSTKTQMINKMTFPLALPGILTGIILSMSISIGETAPLLYTAGSSNYFPCGLVNCQVNYLTYVVYNFTKNPSDPNVAYLSVFLLITFVTVLNIVARISLRRTSKI